MKKATYLLIVIILWSVCQVGEAQVIRQLAQGNV